MTLTEQARRKRLTVRRSLLKWFDRNARDLPWRRSRDPYHVWVSEIMLQQTRVETVVPYFNRFIEKFPTVQELASGDPDDVLKLWEGLGYYSRAQKIHETSKIIVEKRQGIFPRTVDEWRQLPGIGEYTAGAIVSIAYDVSAPILDGNVKRVLARLFHIKSNIDDSSTIRSLWGLAELLVPSKNAGSFNQSLMELGARICTPRRPICAECPLRRICEACKKGSQEELPERRKRNPVPHYDIVAAAIRKNGRFLLGKRPFGGMLGGLWEFPGGKIEEGESHYQALIRESKEELDIDVRPVEHVATVNHAYSHFTITLHVYLCEHIDGKPRANYHSEIKWIPRAHFDRYAFPAADLKFLSRL